VGEDALEVYNTINFASEEAKLNMDTVLRTLEDHFTGMVNTTYERYKFNQRNQQTGESFDDYLRDLRGMLRMCEYGTMAEELLRDRLICGIRGDTVRKALLQKRKLELSTCIDICRSAELAAVQLKAMADPEPQESDDIHLVKKKTSDRKTRPSNKSKISDMKQVKCDYCGENHLKGRDHCKAFGQKCQLCQKPNHFANVCRSRQATKIHAVTQDSNDEYLMTLSLTSNRVATVAEKHPGKIYATMNVEGRQVNFQLDTGATCNILSQSDLAPHITIEATQQSLTLFDESRIQPLGKCTVQLTNPKNGAKYRGDFIVVDKSMSSLLGARSIQQMGLMTVVEENILKTTLNHKGEPASHEGWPLTRDQIVSRYADVFDGQLGTLAGELHLDIDNSVRPVQLPVRRVPVAVKDQLLDELERLEKKGVIERVDEPTDWVSALVVVKKPNGKLRICIDPKPLNMALKRCHYPMATIDDLLSSLTEAKVFSVCDAENGFWHVVLDDASSRLTTFGTPVGRYRFRRMPFGISPAPEIFQRKLNEALEGLKGIYVIADDILVTGCGSTQNEAVRDHDRNISALLERCQERGVKLNKGKLRLRESKVTYMGYVLTGNGLKPDPNKVEAILQMTRPQDVEGVRRLLGMINYLSRFMPNLSDMVEPMRQLTRPDIQWEWSSRQELSFQNVKQAIATAPVLRYFNSKARTVLQCDASSTGLGAVLLQEQQPVAYASRALTETEQGYAQIEKELLAIVFGMERFDQYTFGRDIEVQSDHKPLETIVGKPLQAAPKRLQRMLLCLQRYTITVTYTKGKDVVLADTFSRVHLPSATSGDDANVEVLRTQSVFEVKLESIQAVDCPYISGAKIAEIRSATEADPVLQDLIVVIQNGWPETKRDLCPSIQPYYHFRDELVIEDGVVYRGNRCVIPRALRPYTLRRIHQAHIGIEGCLRRARDSVFWPGMNAAIKDVISKCTVCRTYEKRQPKESIQSHEIPTLPWSKVGADIMTFQGRNYLVSVDYYSSFIEVDPLQDITSRSVIMRLKAQFARHGIPQVLVTDNGPQFLADEFRSFSKQWEFTHAKSSPYHPQGNGKA
jgi:hypothetical protein